MNKKIIKEINSNNPETIQNWSEELARQDAYDFSPISSPSNSGSVELEEISIESINSSEYESVSSEDTDAEVEEKEEEPVALG